MVTDAPADTAPHPSSNRDANPEHVLDVFAAASLLSEAWNSQASAIAPELIAWRCQTWGSGEGCCDWLDTKGHLLAAAALGLRTWNDDEQRNTLVVEVPLGLAREARRLADVADLGEEWPWGDEDDHRSRDELDQAAALHTGLPLASIRRCEELRRVLQLPKA